jgi:WD40 repeat protein
MFPGLAVRWRLTVARGFAPVENLPMLSRQPLLLAGILLTLAALQVAHAAWGEEKGSDAPAGRPRLDSYGDPLPAGALARLGTARWHHPGGHACALAFSPDGKSLVSASDHLVVVWDRASGRPVRRFPIEPHYVKAVAFAPGGKVLVLASVEYEGVDSSGVRPSGAAACLLEADTGRELRHFPGHVGGVYGAAFGPGGKVVATAAAEVHLWEAGSGKEVRRLAGNQLGARALAFAPDGSLLATAHDAHPHPLRLWNTATGKEVRRLDATPRYHRGLAFSPDGKTLAAAGEEVLAFWEVATGRQLRRVDDGPADVGALAFSPDGRQLAAGEEGGRIAFWDVDAGEEFRGAEVHTGTVWAVAFSADGRTVYTASADGAARVWDAATGRHLRSFPIFRDRRPIAITPCCTFTPDGTLLAAAKDKEGFRVWSTADGREVLSVRTPGWDALAVGLSADGRTLAAGGWDGKTGRVVLWDVTGGKKRGELKGLSSRPHSLGFSPDGTTLAVGQPGCETSVWDVATRKKRAEFGGRSWTGTLDVRFSPDGKSLALGYGLNSPGLWELATVQEVHWLVPGPGFFRSLWSVVAFSPDGKLVASSGGEDEVRLVEVATGKTRARLPGHHRPVSSLAFAPDGRTLVSGSGDNTALVWEVPAALRGKNLPPTTPRKATGPCGPWPPRPAKVSPSSASASGRPPTSRTAGCSACCPTWTATASRSGSGPPDSWPTTETPSKPSCGGTWRPAPPWTCATAWSACWRPWKSGRGPWLPPACEPGAPCRHWSTPVGRRRGRCWRSWPAVPPRPGGPWRPARPWSACAAAASRSRCLPRRGRDLAAGDPMQRGPIMNDGSTRCAGTPVNGRRGKYAAGSGTLPRTGEPPASFTRLAAQRVDPPFTAGPSRRGRGGGPSRAARLAAPTPATPPPGRPAIRGGRRPDRSCTGRGCRRG